MSKKRIFFVVLTVFLVALCLYSLYDVYYFSISKAWSNATMWYHDANTTRDAEKAELFYSYARICVFAVVRRCICAIAPLVLAVFNILIVFKKTNFLNFTKLTYEEYKTAALNRKKARLKKQLNNLEKSE